MSSYISFLGIFPKPGIKDNDQDGMTGSCKKTKYSYLDTLPLSKSIKFHQMGQMFTFLDKITYAPLVIGAIFLGLAPFSPQPHILEKLNMLVDGSLYKPIDIFDLLFHLSPTILLLIKLVRSQTGSRD